MANRIVLTSTPAMAPSRLPETVDSAPRPSFVVDDHEALR